METFIKAITLKMVLYFLLAYFVVGVLFFFIMSFIKGFDDDTPLPTSNETFTFIILWPAYFLIFTIEAMCSIVNKIVVKISKFKKE